MSGVIDVASDEQIETLVTADADQPCECPHACEDEACTAEHACGERATCRVTSPCSEDGCPNAGCVELLCDECAASRIGWYGATRVTIREL